MRSLWFLLFMILCLVPACSMFSSSDDDAAEELAASNNEVQLVEKARAEANKYPGSLWNENSHWNRMYSVASSRRVGDVIFIEPTERFMKTLALQAGEKIEEKKGGGRKKEKQDYIAGTIEEIKGRGIYRIVAIQSFKVGQRENELNLVGLLREGDISENDVISSDMVFSMNLTFQKATGEKKKKEDEDAKKEKKEAKS